MITHKLLKIIALGCFVSAPLLGSNDLNSVLGDISQSLKRIATELKSLSRNIDDNAINKSIAKIHNEVADLSDNVLEIKKSTKSDD